MKQNTTSKYSVLFTAMKGRDQIRAVIRYAPHVFQCWNGTNSVRDIKMRRYDTNKHKTYITDDDKAVSKYSNTRYTGK